MANGFIWAFGLFTLACLGGAVSQIAAQGLNHFIDAAIFTRRVLALFPDRPKGTPRNWWEVAKLWWRYACESPDRIWRNSTGEEACWPGVEPETHYPA